MIRVLIVDDSSVVRKLHARALRGAPDIEIAGEAADPFQARDLILQQKPDVVLLDIEMPRMDGITFLRKLMVHHPLPVIICSSLTSKGSHKALEAMDAGAVGVIAKPDNLKSSELASELVEALRSAAAAVVRPRPAVRAQRERLALNRPSPQVVIGIGASTGGTVAIEEILSQLPAEMPPIVVTQHMPAYMSSAFAERMNRLSALEVLEARENEPLQAGRVLIAPGGMHLYVERDGAALVAHVDRAPAVNGHRPSVDVLFHSIATARPRGAVTLLLTGMGRDGAKGMLELRAAGGYTIAQDEASSVVFGMPKAAIDLDAVEEVCSLAAMPERLLAAVGRGASTHVTSLAELRRQTRETLP